MPKRIHTMYFLLFKLNKKPDFGFYSDVDLEQLEKQQKKKSPFEFSI